MENYIVSARKYRPGTFASVVGQANVTNTLRSAILMKQLAHAFLFSGPRGVGKTTCARILAKAINCENLTPEGEPCNECQSCQSFNDGKSLVIHELDAASNNSVDDIRNLIEQTRYVPPSGKDGQARRSVYIIDEVHMLSQAAFNAFLKTLEEPPAHVLFILATTEKHKILPTILSRCQKHDFRRIKVEDIARHLEYISKEEKVDYEYAALQQIALKADGALRDALSLYDQLVSYAGGKLSFDSVLENLNILDYDYYFKSVESMLGGDHNALLLLLDEVIDKGFEAKDYMVGLTEHLRNLLVSLSPETVKLLETSENVKNRYLEQSRQCEGTFLLNAFNLCAETEKQLRQASHPRLQVELSLVKLAHLQQAIHLSTAAPAAEKKKPLAPKAEPSPVQNDQKPPTEEVEPPPSEEKENKQEAKPVEEVSAEKEAVTPPTTQSAAPPVSGLAMLQDLDTLKQAFQEDAAQIKDSDSEFSDDPTFFSRDPSIQIDPQLFQAALDDLLTDMKARGKFTVASFLEQAGNHLEHNCWKVKVDEMGKGLLERDQEVLPRLREKLSVPNFFLEIEVAEVYVNPEDVKPYTAEGKLLEMTKRNPVLKELQSVFKTRIIYK